MMLPVSHHRNNEVFGYAVIVHRPFDRARISSSNPVPVSTTLNFRPRFHLALQELIVVAARQRLSVTTCFQYVGKVRRDCQWTNGVWSTWI